MKPISIVMLAYNEEGIIEETIKKYHQEIISKIPNSEFVIAEDGSKDKTKDILQRIKKKYNLRIVSGNKRKGYTKAMCDGLKLAEKDLIFFSDSDGQHDPKDFWKLYKEIKDYDVISGCKTHRKDNFSRRWFSKGMNGLLWLFFGIKLKDANSGFKLMKKEVIDKIANEDFTMMLASVELMVKATQNGFKIKEIPVQHFERKFGDSRGIPSNIIPKIIKNTLLSFIRFKIRKF